MTVADLLGRTTVTAQLRAFVDVMLNRPGKRRGPQKRCGICGRNVINGRHREWCAYRSAGR